MAIRLLASSAVLALAAAAGTVDTAVASAATPARIAPAAAARCGVFEYVGKHGVTSYHAKATITHLSLFPLSPSGERQITKTASVEQVITAATSKSGGAEGGASWLWGSVKGHFDVTVGKTKQHTASQSVSVTDTVRNPGTKNAQFVAFRGTEKFTGGYYTTYCKGDGGGSRNGTVVKRIGTWRTFRVATNDGIVRCGAGDAGNAVVAAALKFCG